MSKRSKEKKLKELVVFTDGSCMGNGNKGAIGGIGIHFPNKELKDISKVYRDGFCTNQRTELYAILTALRYIKKNLGLSKYHVHIKTDSNYSINCITKWVKKWKKNGWKTTNGDAVSNKEYIEVIDKYCNVFNITFTHVPAHTGKSDANSRANAKADELATSASQRARNEAPTQNKSHKFTPKNSAPGNIIVELVKS